jgi:hypothetical protein
MSAAHRHEQHQAIRANPAMPVADSNDLLLREADFLHPVVHEHEIVARAVHLGEFQIHEPTV